MIDNSWKTAIPRTRPSSPVRWVEERHQKLSDNPEWRIWDQTQSDGLRTKVLDYGCGRGFDAFYMGADRYDPYWCPMEPSGPYDVIFCTYVLNVLDRQKQLEVLKHIDRLLASTGAAYVTVRRDEGVSCLEPKQHKGYSQYYVLDGDMGEAGYIPVYTKKNAYQIYVKPLGGEY